MLRPWPGLAGFVRKVASPTGLEPVTFRLEGGWFKHGIAGHRATVSVTGQASAPVPQAAAAPLGPPAATPPRAVKGVRGQGWRGDVPGMARQLAVTEC
jgi:hypothetical protein